MKSIPFIILVLLLSAIIRVVIPWDTIMGDTIRYNTVDSYYFVYLAELYPHIPDYEWLIGYPDGMRIIAPFWSQLLGFIGNVEFTAALLPAILGCLTVIPVYFISKIIIGHKLALITAVVYSVFGGNLLIRTQLGAADHHALELFAFMYTIMFLFLFVNNRKWYYLIASLPFVVLYMVSWGGWYLIYGLMILYIIYECYRIFDKAFLTLVLVSGIVIVGGILVVAYPYLVDWITHKANIIIWNINSSVAEESPLFFTNGRFQTGVVWAEFELTFYLTLLGIGAFIYKIRKNIQPHDAFFIITTASMFILTLAQRRFAMYLTFEVIILAVYFAYILVKALPLKPIITSVGLIILIVIPTFITSANQVTDKRALITDGFVETTQWLRWDSFLDKNTSNDWRGNKYMADWESYKYSNEQAEYGVITWWDYGYWILQKSKCGVYSAPGSDNNRQSMAMLLLEDDIDGIADFMSRSNLKYVIIDGTMATSKFNSMIKVSQHHEYVESYYFDGDKYKDTVIYQLYFNEDCSKFDKVFETNSKLKINGIYYSEVKIFEVKQ